MGVRNPPWKREELVLALDLYFRVDASSISVSDPLILGLSDTLNNLPFDDRPEPDKYRNPNGVYMKLQNFAALDSGKGLSHGGKMDELVWNEFKSDRAGLAQAAAEIRSRLAQV